MKKRIIINLIVCFILFLPQLTHSTEKITLNLEHVSGNIYCLNGQGGNIGILKSEKGLFIVDSKYEKTADMVVKKIRSISSKPIKYLILTHYHGDHTGGIEGVGKNAILISHKNCLTSLAKSLETKEMQKEYISKIKTYDKKMDIQFGNEKIKLLYLEPAHTSGDTVLVFETSKVIHTGDLFFNGLPPYIDVKDGSNTKNWIRIIEFLCKTYPDYKIIPGHGKVTDTQTYLQFANYLKYLRKEVKAAIKAGKTREQAMKEINLDSFSHIKDHKRFLTKANNIGWIYDEMSKK